MAQHNLEMVSKTRRFFRMCETCAFSLRRFLSDVSTRWRSTTLSLIWDWDWEVRTLTCRVVVVPGGTFSTASTSVVRSTWTLASCHVAATSQRSNTVTFTRCTQQSLTVFTVITSFTISTHTAQCTWQMDSGWSTSRWIRWIVDGPRTAFSDAGPARIDVYTTRRSVFGRQLTTF